MALKLVGLHNTYRDFAGNTASGQVIFQPDAGVLEAELDTTYSPLPIIVDVLDGELTTTLAAPLTVTDTRITYLVTEQLAPVRDGANLPPYRITMPAQAPDGAVLELSDRDEDGYIPLPGDTAADLGIWGIDGTFGGGGGTTDVAFGSDSGGF